MKLSWSHITIGLKSWITADKLTHSSWTSRKLLIHPRKNYLKQAVWVWYWWKDSEMDRFFSLFQTAASCSKWNKIGLGLRFVRCPSGHRPWTSVVLIVYQRYHNRHWLRDKAVCWWLCLLSRNQRYRGHCETSGGYRSSWLLGKKMGHEIPTSQMQYHTDYKETDQKDQCFL